MSIEAKPYWFEVHWKGINSFVIQPQNERNFCIGNCAKCGKDKADLCCSLCGLTTFCSGNCALEFRKYHLYSCSVIRNHLKTESGKRAFTHRLRMAGDICFELGLMEKCIDFFFRHLEIVNETKTEKSIIIFKVILAYMWLNKYDEGEEHFLKLLEDHESFLDDFLGMQLSDCTLEIQRSVFVADGKYGEREFDIHDTCRSVFGFYFKKMACEAMEKGDFSKSLELLQKVESLIPRDYVLPILRMKCFKRMNDIENLLKVFYDFSFRLTKSQILSDSLSNIIHSFSIRRPFLSVGGRIARLDFVENISRAGFDSVDKLSLFYDKLIKRLSGRNLDIFLKYYSKITDKSASCPTVALIEIFIPDTSKSFEELHTQFYIEHSDIQMFLDGIFESLNFYKRFEYIRNWSHIFMENTQVGSRWSPFLEDTLKGMTEEYKHHSSFLKKLKASGGVFRGKADERGIVVIRSMDTGSFGSVFSVLIRFDENQDPLVSVMKILHDDMYTKKKKREILERELLKIPYHRNCVSVHSLGAGLDYKIDAEDFLLGMGSEKVDERMKRNMETLDEEEKQVLDCSVLFMDNHKKDLDHYVLQRRKDNVPFDDVEIALMLRGLIRGICHLQKHGIVHRDLHPGNIFVDESFGRIWIGDYGCCLNLGSSDSFKVSKDHEMMNSATESYFKRGGCSAFLPPEIVDFDYEKDLFLDYSKCDVFSVGMNGYLLCVCVHDENSAMKSVVCKDVGECVLPAPFGVDFQSEEPVIVKRAQHDYFDLYNKFGVNGDISRFLSNLLRVDLSERSDCDMALGEIIFISDRLKRRNEQPNKVGLCSNVEVGELGEVSEEEQDVGMTKLVKKSPTEKNGKDQNLKIKMGESEFCEKYGKTLPQINHMMRSGSYSDGVELCSSILGSIDRVELVEQGNSTSLIHFRSVVHLNRGYFFLNLQKFSQAVLDFRKSLEFGGNNDRKSVYWNIGACFCALGNSCLAVEAFTRGIHEEVLVTAGDVNLILSCCFSWRGGILEKHGIYKEALDDYNQAIELKKNDKDACFYNYRGTLLFHAFGEVEQAKDDFSESLRIDPHDYEVFCWRGICSLELGDYFNALLDFSRGIVVRGQEKVRGWTKKRFRRKGKVLPTSLREPCDSVEEHSLALRNRSGEMFFLCKGMLYHALDRYDSAIEDFEKVLLINPNNIQASLRAELLKITQKIITDHHYSESKVWVDRVREIGMKLTSDFQRIAPEWERNSVLTKQKYGKERSFGNRNEEDENVEDEEKREILLAVMKSLQSI